MNNNAKKWVAALRGGQYKQGIGCLRNGNNYCCLGVACDLYCKEEGDISLLRGRHYFYGDEKLVLPIPVKKWLRLSENDGYFVDNDNVLTSLASRNDDGYTFNEIADIIESEPEGLFADA